MQWSTEWTRWLDIIKFLETKRKPLNCFRFLLNLILFSYFSLGVGGIFWLFPYIFSIVVYKSGGLLDFLPKGNVIEDC